MPNSVRRWWRENPENRIVILIFIVCSGAAIAFALVLAAFGF